MTGALVIAGLAVLGVIASLKAHASEAETYKNLQRWFAEYSELWVEPKMSDVPAIVAYFRLPLHIVDESGDRYIRSETELANRYMESLRDPAKYNYSGDLLLASDIQLLSPVSARIEADWMELDLDRNPKSCFGRSYSLRLSDGVWKIREFSARGCKSSSLVAQDHDDA